MRVNHAENRDRQQIACAAVQLLSVLSSLQNTHKRVKRGVDDLCVSPLPFEQVKNEVFTLEIFEGVKFLIFFATHLAKVNKVRHEILKTCLVNAHRISHSTENKIRMMADEEIISSFEKYTGVKISHEMVGAVRKKSH